MKLAELLPFFDKLDSAQRDVLQNSAVLCKAEKGKLLYNGTAGCLGLIVITSGQLRAFICSEEGKEVTVYRLFERDICLFSASCIMHSIQFDITVTAEKDTEFWLIPSDTYKKLMEQSAAVANYTNELMAARFSDVMWLVEQVMWKSFDSRLATFLLEESALEGGDTLKITHEIIASHMGTAREVVTRMLKYFQSEGLVKLSRGSVQLEDRKGLYRVSKNSK